MNNFVKLVGHIVEEPKFEYEAFGEKFYAATLAILRISNTVDLIPLIIPERIGNMADLQEGVIVAIEGQYRSQNCREGEKRHTRLSVFVNEYELVSDNSIDENEIELIGYVCKPVVYRKTPSGRQIADVFLAVNRRFNKSDYIPLIVWGRNAVFAKGLEVGAKIEIKGRIQSRDYRKRIDDNSFETRTAYEVSAREITVVEE